MNALVKTLKNATIKCDEAYAAFEIDKEKAYRLRKQASALIEEIWDLEAEGLTAPQELWNNFNTAETRVTKQIIDPLYA